MTSKTRSILLAAVLATPVAFWAPSAMGQNRIDTGAANDANNRIGSGGYNGPGRPLNINSGDNVVTGNVTGGREFRGRAASTDPRAFRGSLAGEASDRLIRSSASPYENNAQQVKQFWGNSEGVAPPPNFVQVAPGSQTYTPAPPPERLSSDVRMGAVYSSDRTQFVNPAFGEMVMPGQLDNSNTQSLLRASPLYGVVQEDGSSLSDSARIGYQNIRRRSALDEKDVLAARQELRDSVVSDNPNDKAAKTPGGDLNLSAKSAISNPLENPESSALPGQNLDSTLKTQQMNGQIRSEASQRNELVPPAEQSTQLAELHNRYGKMKPTGPLNDQQAANLYRQEKTARDEEIEKLKREKLGGNTARPGASRIMPPSGGGGVPSAGGGTAVSPGPAVKTPEGPDQPTQTPASPGPVEAPKDTTPAPKPAATEGPAIDTTEIRPGQPLKINSLADGMKAGRVRDLLVSAEDQMRAGKYGGAIEQYDFAERIVPNNPMITLGRAHAELGGSYYARAETNIRKAFDADNAMLLAQFDLSKVLGKDRIAFLEKDLKEIATTETKQARAPFLLAYLKYHTGDKKMASNYLALSEQRLGKEDPLFKQIRRTWDLPKPDALPDANK